MAKNTRSGPEGKRRGDGRTRPDHWRLDVGGDSQTPIRCARSLESDAGLGDCRGVLWQGLARLSGGDARFAGEVLGMATTLTTSIHWHAEVVMNLETFSSFVPIAI